MESFSILHFDSDTSPTLYSIGAEMSTAAGGLTQVMDVFHCMQRLWIWIK